METFAIFTQLATIFYKEGFRLYIVGGAVRDYLLKRPIGDFDLVSDATPEQMQQFIEDADYTFARFGTVSFYFLDQHIEVTTLREEGEYKDYRHPSKITFITDINRDYLRRDFTINAIYLDEVFKIHDPANGMDDLANKLIRMIGDPWQRFKEDPLRILRALRFKIALGFELESELEQALKDQVPLLKHLTPAKVNDEIIKIEKINLGLADEILQRYEIAKRY